MKTFFTDVNIFKKELLRALNSQTNNCFRSDTLTGILQEHIEFKEKKQIIKCLLERLSKQDVALSSVNNNKNQHDIMTNWNDENNALPKKSKNNNNNARNNNNNKNTT